MKYYKNVHKCPSCKENNDVFFEGVPHIDLAHRYSCTSCGKEVELKPSPGILVDEIPKNAVVISPIS